jgi:exosortase C (VPDSG-CTERM-specific)
MTEFGQESNRRGFSSVRPGQGATRRPLCFLLLVILALTIFHRPLIALVPYALHSDLNSQVILIPFVAGYLLWLRKQDFLSAAEPPARLLSVLLFVLAGLAGLAPVLAPAAEALPKVDQFALAVFAFVTFVLGGFALCFGRGGFRAALFPLLFLYFMIPIPTPIEEAVARILQRLSADAAHLLFMLAGTPVFREGQVFHLPGLSVEVAEVCSGIHSTYVLLISSLLAAHLFLRTGWRKVLLAVIVVPIGIFRNGVRVLVISLLTVYVDPQVIKGPLHHHGGPVFFALSLIPFFAVVVWLWRSEKKKLAGTGAGRAPAPGKT